ncbi:MAG TPA: alpha-glucuronidase family glycosyl hydrolase, partial [Gemmatimonadaceae bacterium]|nr:alpha-glucuronidase family glycosyl hydrolase [Gemmatimonadaceae bacterium]
MIRFFFLVVACAVAAVPLPVRAEDGYELWLRYRLVTDSARLAEYRAGVGGLSMPAETPTLRVARDELTTALNGLTGVSVRLLPRATRGGVLIVGTPVSSPVVAGLASRELAAALRSAGAEGYVIRAMELDGRRAIVIAANRDVGVLYGAFHFIRLMQTHRSLAGLDVVSAPTVQFRMLDHWDNLDRSVERGYAGRSLWDWSALPNGSPTRYVDYARANASIGINAVALTNVNANARVLTPEYLAKVAALANLFRPYGIRVFLTARFSAPKEIGGLRTADPLDTGVRAWWKGKADEIYKVIPDFGGFLVKANSEGQPGPQDYRRTHADGANMLADAVASHGGVVIWRAFVYSNEVPVDRIRQAYDEFHPLDGAFRENVFVQVKNGALDFQPREPFHPLFGGMPRTPLMMEFQITKEYLGQDTHLVYLAPLFEEVLDADTWAAGQGSTVAKVLDGTVHGYRRTGMAGVSNVGTDRNWTGSQFNQANWYAFGRLAWDHGLSSSDIADEWIRMTFTHDSAAIASIRWMMLASREAVVNYMTPLGIVHIMATGHHYGPGPWAADAGRADWTPSYYHRADTLGMGFDRTASGSNAAAQYHPPVRDRYANRATVPDSVLLWFHRVRWTERLPTGRTLWDELVHRYSAGVDTVRAMQARWATVRGAIDSARFAEVDSFLTIQVAEARWWRDASLAYFQTFSRMP